MENGNLKIGPEALGNDLDLSHEDMYILQTSIHILALCLVAQRVVPQLVASGVGYLGVC